MPKPSLFPIKRKLELVKKPSSTDHRWPPVCLENGEWFRVPKVLFRELAAFSAPKVKPRFRPHHLWLLLALQADRYRDRPPRYFWANIAGWSGYDKNTVRRWGYELQRMGLLLIVPCKELNPDQERHPGTRNERNKFLLEPLEKRVEAVHLAWTKRRKKRARKTGAGSGEPEVSAAVDAS